MHRIRLVLVLIPVLMIAAPATPALAAGPGTCNAGTDGNYFSGQKQAYPPTYGVSATVGFEDEALCTNTGNMGASFSSTWVGISSGQSAYDIYQVGFDKCQYAGCPTGTRYFYAYGHHDGSCGRAVPPVPVWLTSASGSNTYKIDRVYQSGIGYTYAAYVNSSMKNWHHYTDIDTCWGPSGPGYWGVRNEVGDRGDQSGGSVGLHQLWSSIKFKSSSGWINAVLVLGGGCSPAPSLSTQKCLHDGSLHDRIWTWDSRVP